MENLDELTYLVLDRYFSVLEKTGYILLKDVNKIILLTFLLEFITKYPYYITEQDYSLISSIIKCLYGSSCLIPYTLYLKMSEPIDNYVLNIPIRISVELLNIRHTLEEYERLVNN